MRAGGILPHPVPQPAHQVRQAPPQTSLPPHRLRLRHRADLLRPTHREDSDRAVDPRHADIAEHVPVADQRDDAWLHVRRDLRCRGLLTVISAKTDCGAGDPRPVQ